MGIKTREFNHVHTFTHENGVEQIVCRDFFFKCLQATPYRIFSALKSIKSNTAAVDKRGKGSSANKRSTALLENVRQFIDRIPKYESHYSRSNTQRKYLHHSLNLATLYKEYKSNRDPEKKSVSVSMFSGRSSTLSIT